jgi:biofilm PGA synthesis lipoprotein PgaB
VTRHSVRSFLRRFSVLIGVGLVALLVLVPAFGFARLTTFKSNRSSEDINAQAYVAGYKSPVNLVTELSSTNTGVRYPPIIVTYHDIAVKGTQYTVTPAAFAAQMRMLHDSGWHTLTAAQFEAWLHGAPLPPRSLLLTFDDGARGVYRYADPVLRHYGMHGIAFIITGWVGTHEPYYMTWPQLHQLQADGHWDLEAHTHLGHGFVASNAKGTLQPFLATLKWLPEQHRSETLAEYRTRVQADLQQCIADLVERGFPRPQLFAYPFSAIGNNVVGNALYQIVHSMFNAAFLDSSTGRPTALDEDASHQFRRVDTVRNESLAQYTHNIEISLQQPVFTIKDASWRHYTWTSTSGTNVKVPATGPVLLSSRLTGDEYGEMHLDPAYTSFWTDYQASATFSGLHSEEEVRLAALLDSDDEVVVTVSRSSYSLYKGADANPLESGPLMSSGPSHQITMTVRPGQVIVSIDGQFLRGVSTNPASRGGITVGGEPAHGTQQLTRVLLTPLGTS